MIRTRMWKNACMMLGVGALAATLPMTFAQHDGQAKSNDEVKSDPYTLDVCPVSGEKLGEHGDPVIKVVDGREMRFCCNDCVSMFENNPEKYQKRADKMIIEQQAPWYPMETCVVSGEALGGMGEPVNYVHNNRLVRFCCAGCVDMFKKDPEKHIEKIDAKVVEKQAENYPLGQCIISDQALDSMGGPLDKVYANRLVRFCCGGCIKSFMKDSANQFAKIDEAYGAHLPSKHEGMKRSDKKSGHEGDGHGG